MSRSNANVVGRRSIHLKRELALRRIDECLAAGLEAKRDVSRLSTFLSRFSKLETHCASFETHHLKLCSELTDTECLDKEDEIRLIFDDKYFQIIEIHSLLTSKDQPTVAGDPRCLDSSVKLPRLNLLHFDGDVKAWGTFYDMYNTMVHQNKKLSNIERFSILLSLLHGEPLQLLKGFPLSENNYLDAYGALIDRYQCKRKLAFHHWEELHKIKCKFTSPAELRHLVDTFKENIAVLKNLRLPVDNWDFPLFHLLINKLDFKTRERFELQNDSRDIPTFASLLEFLDKASQALDLADPCTTVVPNKPPRTTTNRHHLVPPRTRALVVDNRPENSTKCISCQGPHFVTQCTTFQSLNPRARYDFIKKNRCCVNCLRSGHVVRSCPSKYRCTQCRAPHHSLLHFDHTGAFNRGIPLPAAAASEGGQSGQVNSPTSISLFTDPSFSMSYTPLLATAVADVLDCHGNCRKIRIVIDSGSQSNFITKSCAHRLGLSLRRVSTSVEGIGRTLSTMSSLTSFRLLGLDSCLNVDIQAFAVTSICSSMPASKIDTREWPILKSLRLADSNFNVPGPVDALVGVDVFCRIFKGDRLDCTPKGPTAFKTKLGWIVMGNVLGSIPVSISSLMCNSALEHQIRKFWEIDELSLSPKMSDEDALCESIFKNTHAREPNGRYIVRLPFKSASPTFGNSFTLAHCRLLSLERRLSRSPELRKEYNCFMQDYLDAGHMELIDNPVVNKAYYIPHHCVLKPTSSTTRLRVVFDASARPSDGPSLNDQLLVGPKLQADINSILLRFRLHRVAFIADIKQMYRQVALSPQDRDWQRILFRFDTNQPICHYRLKTVTYGLASSSFLALRTILQVAEDEGRDSPLAREVLSRDVYVDDVVSGADDEEAALEAQQQLISVLGKGCFELRKWTSNSVRVLNNVPIEHRCNQSAVFDCEDMFFVKVLGLQWNPAQDTFSYQCNIRHDQCTKRHVLSELARIFDPLGFITPLTFAFKCIIQKIWTLGLDWDDPVPDCIAKDWSRCRSNLSSLANLNLARFVPTAKSKRVEIHGFCDASELGYAAAVYFRVEDDDGQVTTHLIISRSKVASLKKISIPRLELCSAVLLSELVDYVKSILRDQVNFHGTFCWSDSMVTLAWLRSPSSRWKTFVGNRVGIIQERVAPVHWHYVKSEDNPADCASRGLHAHELIHHPLWWHGPEWLSTPQGVSLINHPSIEEPIDAVMEQRQPPVSLFVTAEHFDPFLNRFSSLSKVTRIVAYVHRFIYNSRNPCNRKHGHLVALELDNAMLTLVKLAQISTFSQEIDCIKRGISLPKPLRKLHPFIDEGGLVRVGGRLAYSELAYDNKHPLLLSRQHRLTELLIDQVHKDNLHPGLRTLSFLLAQNYWILSSRRAIRSRLSKCIRCYRTNPKPVVPRMGNLPKLRVSQVKTFSSVGVDFAGPFPLYIKRHRGARPFKGYICLFVCFATKAIHLELVCSLSSEAFLGALRRFIGRRGRCQRIHCDRGTNFVGAANTLSSLMLEAASTEAIEFSFNPPAASHFGGLWEINVRSFKTHLTRTIGNQILTYEEFSTLMVQIEALLNSRPLCEMSSDPNDTSVLTPGHFLTLEPLTSLPERQNLDSINCLDRWQLVQKIHRDFWKRWHVEYLHTLNQRAKWHIDSKEPKIGSLVIIKDDQLKPLQWSLARIVKLHPGRDGISRVATVKTQNGQLQRPLVKLCPLPID